MFNSSAIYVNNENLYSWRVKGSNHVSKITFTCSRYCYFYQITLYKKLIIQEQTNKSSVYYISIVTLDDNNSFVHFSETNFNLSFCLFIIRSECEFRLSSNSVINCCGASHVFCRFIRNFLK